MRTVRYDSLYQRLLANSRLVDGQNENGCWQWTGRTDGKPWPYGRMNVYRDGKHKTVQPHREMEQQFRDEPLCPETQTIDHLCGNTLCINPDHWLLETRAVNTARSQAVNPRRPTRGRA
jgi:hypothetical protein